MKTTVNVFETWAIWEGERSAQVYGEETGPICGGAATFEGGPGRQWTPESMLVGAVELRVMMRFLELGEQAGFRPLFYQSNALGRLGRCGDATAQLTDLIIRPRVGLPNATQAEQARLAFAQIAAERPLGLALTPALRIQPVVETWAQTADESRAEPRFH